MRWPCTSAWRTSACPSGLDQRGEALTQAGELKLAAEYRQLWDILCGGLEQCALLLDDTPMDLETFAQLFGLVLSQYDVGAIPVSLDRVTAGENTRMTQKKVQVLFWLGADSASVPPGRPHPPAFSPTGTGRCWRSTPESGPAPGREAAPGNDHRL